MKINKRKVILSLLLIWICFGLLLIILNYSLLSQPIVHGRFALARLIPPLESTAKKVTESMPMEDVISILGHPDGHSLFTGMQYLCWDLQGGKQLWLAEYCNYALNPHIIQEYQSSRWLVFPSLMILVAAVELVTYFIIHKRGLDT